MTLVPGRPANRTRSVLSATTNLLAPAALPALAAAAGAIAATAADAGGTRATTAPVSAAIAASRSSVLISAVFADGYATGDMDEAIQVWNSGGAAVDLSGWAVSDREGSVGFPAGARLAAGAYWWLARDPDAFARSFGHRPDWSWSQSAAEAERLIGTSGGLSLANRGDRVELRDRLGSAVDVVEYGRDVESADPGWTGEPVREYGSSSISKSHQVLYRKLSPDGSAPLADTDSQADWASDPGDPALGRRARYPGWDVEHRTRPVTSVADGRWEIAVAPDALSDFLTRHFGAAETSIDFLGYTLEHAPLAEVLAAKAADGVRVRILLDGRPAGGISHQQRWCVARVAAAGGEVYWLDSAGDVGARYRAYHAKTAVVDGRLALLGSENPGPASAPSDDRSDGTAGRRGVWLATDAPPVVEWVAGLVARDLDPTAHLDVRPFQERDVGRGAPADDFVPDAVGGGAGYVPIASEPLVTTGTHLSESASAPESALSTDAGLLHLLGRAGAADEVLVEQLREPLWWSGSVGEGPAALNPRVQAYLDAARRGARVRVLLDATFDDPGHWNSNARTAALLRAASRIEGLDLEARVGNPTGKGIHNKMVLVALRSPAAGGPTDDPTDQEDWSHIGSLNGSETAHKVNREAYVQLRSPAVRAYLADVFEWDWQHSPTGPVYLPRASSGGP